MQWLQHRGFLIGLSLLLAGCSVLLFHVLRPLPNRHMEIRESFILLETGGYTNESRVLYQNLLKALENLPNKVLIEDWQRTVMLVDPSANLPSNLIWRYHWTVRREMEKRATASIQNARKLAKELQEESEKNSRKSAQKTNQAATSFPN